MRKLNNFWCWFNRPAQVFEAMGNISVFLGLLCIIVGIIQIPSCTIGVSASGGNAPIMLIISGFISAIVAPQLFFAILKVVKAAEKYLGE